MFFIRFLKILIVFRYKFNFRDYIARYFQDLNARFLRVISLQDISEIVCKDL
jgi:hypothetical protein